MELLRSDWSYSNMTLSRKKFSARLLRLAENEVLTKLKRKYCKKRLIYNVTLLLSLHGLVGANNLILVIFVDITPMVCQT